MFIQGKIKFNDIGDIVNRAVDEIKIENMQYTIDDIYNVDAVAKEFVLSHIHK